MQAFKEYGIQRLEYKKGCLRTDDINGAQPKTFKKHIWGQIQTDRTTPDQPLTQRRNPVNEDLKKNQENQMGNSDPQQKSKQQLQQNVYGNPDKINQQHQILLNQNHMQRYIPPSRNPLLLNLEQNNQVQAKPELNHQLSQKAINIKNHFFQEAKKKEEEKNRWQNQFEIGMLDKLQQLNREPQFQYEYKPKERHHYPQKQYYREKLKINNGNNIVTNKSDILSLNNSKTSKNSDLNNKIVNNNIIQQNKSYLLPQDNILNTNIQSTNTNIINNNSSLLLQKQQERKNYKSSDNLNLDRQMLRENLQDNMQNNKLYMFHDPIPYQHQKTRLLKHDMAPYKYDYNIQKNQSQIRI